MRPISRWLGCVALLSLGGAAGAQDQGAAPAQEQAAPAAAEEQAPLFGADELEQIVAPIALYPDSLLAQVFMASTYPVEVVQAERWQKVNPDLKEKALEDALQSQTWDPSVKSLTAFPQVLEMMSTKLDWTQKLGDAFLAQQSDVMDAVQRLRNKAHAEGNLESNEQQKVVVEEAPPSGGTQTIIIQQASPQVVYVPTYNPTVVYGPWPYPAYPPYYYYPPGYVAATSMISFGMGMWAGAALWGDCDWDDGGGGDKVKIDIDKYNNFNKTDIKNGDWNHNVDHRKGVQYRDKRTQDRFGKDSAPAHRTGKRSAAAPAGTQGHRQARHRRGVARSRQERCASGRQAPERRRGRPAEQERRHGQEQRHGAQCGSWPVVGQLRWRRPRQPGAT